MRMSRWVKENMLVWRHFDFNDAEQSITTSRTHKHTQTHDSRASRSGQRCNNLWKSLLSLKITTIRNEIIRTENKKERERERE